ncbi:hypothetical protein N7449_000985 [Penicillium cf. viridicatum]|uniref:Uncharacterized protein n=1 Tax=Penicillium cf. viridicatum TaxID=2972119 RepID=A0A9W9T909_9EURO|nr:hypothetical protein N7449_000985 [Penicillium cf. viridicatum]
MNESPQSYPSLPISSLGINEIQKILGLRQMKENSDTELKDIQPISLPPELRKHFSRIRNAVGDTPNSEAHNRFTLNELIFYAHEHVQKSRSTKSNPIYVQAERTWSYEPVRWKRKLWSLKGRPDYSIWYGDEEEVSVNVIAIEAKSDSGFSSGIPQALGYMGETNSSGGTVHLHRKELKKQDCTVYGVSADKYNFWFGKLDNNSQWTQRVVMTYESEYEEAYGILIHMMNKATTISPSHSKLPSTQTHSHESSRESRESRKSKISFHVKDKDVVMMEGF